MYYWRLPQSNWPLNVWGIALWQHTIFKELMDRTLWRIRSSRSAVLVKLNFCEKNALQLEFHPFSPVFLCEQQKEDRWKEGDTYTAFTRYWLRDVIYQILDICQNWRCLIENRISRLVWLRAYLRRSHILLNSKLILKWCRTWAYFDS